MNGKQVAVVVPTTLLARQHFKTFSERFARLAGQCRAGCRAGAAAEASEDEAGLADGSIDIVVGTHALLGRTIKFKDLGL
jgi:transcription-repair coupling factor (superfamily II helicase)